MAGLLQEAVDAERVAAFAQQLGISAAEDEDFGWIAEVGLQSPLPPRWTSHTDTSTGYVYYVDHDRQVSSWENPLVPFLRRVVELGRAYLQSPSENFFEEQKGLLWHQHKHELDCWNGPFTDDEGRQYFINAIANVSSWQDPRIDAQYIFELESGLLTSLQEVLPAPEPDTPGFGDQPPLLGDGAAAWRSDSGAAEVLTLDGSRPGTGFRKRDRSLRRMPSQVIVGQAQAAAKEEHRGTLEVLCGAADRLHDLRQDDVDAQSLKMKRKVEERRKRRLRAAAGGKAEAGPPLASAAAGGRGAGCGAALASKPRAGGGAGPAPPPLPAVLPGKSRGAARGRPAPLGIDADAGAPFGTGDAGPCPPEEVLPPPPPPVQEVLPVGGAAVGKGHDDLGPPTQAPSPTAGRKPALAPELELRLAEAESKRKSSQGKVNLPPPPAPPFMQLQLKAASCGSPSGTPCPPAAA
eukprot:TRINITY_DN10017_c0_g1_i3.p1 TRINITY_DN10017_c0_g1~~TRINITY_DN10017_c0_g1_i3.p1  ORF type:complete len:464 (+),score=116.45 TRINITY_DN10017_c0_g1_i3:152-1543(+)